MSRPTGESGAGTLDWSAIRERVDALGSALADGSRLSPEKTIEVLNARARALAIPPAPAPADDELEVMELDLADERYAIETRYVVEVMARVEIAYLPGAEPPVVGVHAWRGEVLPYLDLRWALGLATAVDLAEPRLLVLGASRPAFAVQVDGVRGVRRLPAMAIVPLSGEASRGRSFLLGSTADAVLVLDADELIRTHSRGATQ